MLEQDAQLKMDGSAMICVHGLPVKHKRLLASCNNTDNQQQKTDNQPSTIKNKQQSTKKQLVNQQTTNSL